MGPMITLTALVGNNGRSLGGTLHGDLALS